MGTGLDPASQAAYDHLAALDPGFAALLTRVAPPALVPAGYDSPFDALARAVIYQQLSGNVALAIHRRVAKAFGEGPDELPPLVPAAVADAPIEALRAVGLSRQKATSMHALAAAALAGRLERDRLEALGDDAVIADLVAIKGIGRWTAQMFLIFALGRPDVLPELDLGVRKAIARLDGLAELPTPKAVIARGEAWAPQRTAATRLMWHGLDLIIVP